MLRQAVRDERSLHPFEIEAGVILPDHAHFVWTLPEGDADYGRRIGRIKVAFTKALRSSGDGGQCPPYDLHATAGAGRQRGYADVWQPRFWEHTIRDETDFARHVDYIHYNPVKHGYVADPGEWPYSSLHRFVRRGILPPDRGEAIGDDGLCARGEPVGR